MSRALRISTLLALMALGIPASAQQPASDPAKIRAAAVEFDAGRRAFTQEDYASAAPHFENAYRDAPTGEALRLAIRSWAKAGRAARAATLAAFALKANSEDKTTALANKTLEEYASGLYRVNVTCKPACGIVLDGRAVFDAQSDALTLFVEPGSHEISASWHSTRNQSSPVEAVAGGFTDLAFEKAADEVPPPPDKPAVVKKKSGLPPAVTYVGMGVTAVLGGLTIWSGLDAKQNPGTKAVEDGCVNKGESCELYQDGLSRQNRTNYLIAGTAGAAVATAVIGLVFTNWSSDPPAESTTTSKSPPGVRVAPTLSVGQGFGLGAMGRF